MDPQKRFLAATLKGAMEAEVITREDVYRHMGADVLAEHVPSELLWTCILKGMVASGIGPGQGTRPQSPAAKKPLHVSPPKAAPRDDDEAVVEQDDAPPMPDEGPVAGGSIDIDVADALDDLPPLPDDEELAVEDVDWDGDEK
jgi:hypothetical protein